jgi:hypothetical protein
VRTSLRQVKLRVHRLQPDGRLDRAFGRAGIATVALAGPQPPTPPPIDVRRGLQVLDRGRGRVLVVAAVPAAVAYMPPALEPIALTGAGALDPSFGTQGVAMAPVSLTCGMPANVAIAPDGNILRRRDDRHTAVVDNGRLVRSGERRWSVARLAPVHRRDGRGGGARTVGVRRDP